MKAKRREVAPAVGTRGHLLLVEDEQDLQDLLRYNLERNGYHVSTAGSGEKGLQLIRSDPMPEMILLDLMLPGMDGLEVCRTVRGDPRTAHLPILMLTAKTEESDVVTGLELGADDYVTKPFSPKVLLSRVKALMRRRQQKAENPAVDDSLVIRNMTINRERHEVRVDDAPVDLTATEFKLLHLLASRRGRVYTRKMIIESIHGKMTVVTDRSVDVQVVSIRRKLGEVGADLQTIRGVGYRFKDE